MRNEEPVIEVGKKFHFRHLVPLSMLRFWVSADRKCDRRLVEFRNIPISHKCASSVDLKHHFEKRFFFCGDGFYSGGICFRELLTRLTHYMMFLMALFAVPG